MATTPSYVFSVTLNQKESDLSHFGDLSDILSFMKKEEEEEEEEEEKKKMPVPLYPGLG